ncbi:hypothetical protein [Streptomyces clavuligerus]|nr:hypothetical protein [Streptomyces clavuligerus]
MDEGRARRMVEALRGRGVMAHVVEAGVYEFGIRVVLDTDIEALWDVDGAAGLDAEIVGDGVLIGFVPHVPGSEEFTEEQLVEDDRGDPVHGGRPEPARPRSDHHHRRHRPPRARATGGERPGSPGSATGRPLPAPRALDSARQPIGLLPLLDGWGTADGGTGNPSFERRRTALVRLPGTGGRRA